MSGDEQMISFPSDDELMAGPNALGDSENLVSWDENFKSGFVCLVGRPNAGKSTLINALVGQKIAIMSDRPETTRRAVRGIVTRENGQIVLVDTPGVHRPRTLLGKRLNDVVRDTLSDVDAVVICLPADEPIGPGDRRILKEVMALGCPVIACVTKTDKVSSSQLVAKLTEVDTEAKTNEKINFADIIPLCALNPDNAQSNNCQTLIDLLLEKMPYGPPLYPLGDATDEPDQILIAEYIREAALEGVHDELPHSIAVVVEEMVEREKLPGDKRRPLLDVRVDIYVERPSQKGIVIGRGGARLKEVGARARKEIEALLGRRIFLDLHVRVAKDWQRNPKLLNRLGF